MPFRDALACQLMRVVYRIRKEGPKKAEKCSRHAENHRNHVRNKVFCFTTLQSLFETLLELKTAWITIVENQDRS